MSGQLELGCPAKVNLALSVGEADVSGYHPIASWMTAIDLFDRLTLRRASAGSRFDVSFTDGGAVDWPLEADLTYRAHGAMEAHVGRPLPVHGVLEKRIPTGAGLGGGSSDAAGMLLGLNGLFNLRLGVEALADLGGRLGSDVPFFVGAMSGETSAIVTGRGEDLEPTPAAAPIDLVLVLPPLQCPTGRVYAAFDALRSAAGAVDEKRVRTLARGGTAAGSDLFNDLAGPAESVTPGLAEIRRKVGEVAQRPVHITGSGAGMFIVADSAEDAASLAPRIRAQAGVAAKAARTLERRRDAAECGRSDRGSTASPDRGSSGH